MNRYGAIVILVVTLALQGCVTKVKAPPPAPAPPEPQTEAAPPRPAPLPPPMANGETRAKKNGSTATTSRITGLSFLEKNAKEAEGYGLYSYLLFGSRPTSEKIRERYVKAVEAFLTFESVKSLEDQGIPRKKLNISYIPIAAPLPAAIAQKDMAPWIVDNYNYAKAQSLLALFRGNHFAGPYIISTLDPLGILDTEPERYLYQNLSTVPPHVISLWVSEFRSQAAQERFWEENSMKQFALGLRTKLAIAADGMEEIRTTMPDIASVFNGNIFAVTRGK